MNLGKGQIRKSRYSQGRMREENMEEESNQNELYAFMKENFKELN